MLSPLTRLIALALLTGTSLVADWRDDIGHTRLVATFGLEVPNSVTLGLTQVEAPSMKTDAVNYYLPSGTYPAFSGKSINNRSLGSGASGHANEVGLRFYGLNASLLSATTQIDAYNANHWLTDGFLRTGYYEPLIESRQVQNHSWIASYDRDETNTEAAISNYVTDRNRRLDFAINRDGFISVVGMNNGASTTLPDLLGQSYHTISVGLVNGNHSAGLTIHDGTGRMKPDLVAFDGLTSYATPQVAGAAGLLAEKLRTTTLSPILAKADYPRLTKALLLAGATKDPLSAWSRESLARPYDAIYGAGALNIYWPYRIFAAGRQPVTSTLCAETGWDIHTVSKSTTRTYYFNVPEGSVTSRFSAALTWHRSVSRDIFNSSYISSLANLDLRLFTVAPDTLTLETEIDASLSTVDNVEHIYQPALPPGRYALRVTNPSRSAASYALAWRSTPTVTIVATSPVAHEIDATPGTFTLTRTGSITSPLLVPLAWSGDAIGGVHYTTPPSSVLIPAGASSTTITITPIGDEIAQGDRSVVLTLNQDFSLSVGTPSAAVVTIKDKPYSAWRFTHFSTAQLTDPLISGPAADPDGDGIPNLHEYAFVLEPLASDTIATAADRLPAVGIDAENHLSLAYFHASERPDLVFLAEWTDDLAAASWHSGPAFTEEVSRIAVGDGSGERVTVRALAPVDPDSSPRQFLRLRVRIE